MTVASLSPQPTPTYGRPRRALRQEWQLVICALGIYACYMRYGLLQERIYSREYGAHSEKFTYSSFLVAVQTFTNAAVAFLVMCSGLFPAPPKAPKNIDEPNKPNSFGVIRGVPLFDYAFVALSYLSAMLFSFTALNHMSYPMQALGKSCKMIPVMLMGIVIRRHKYSLREYLCVAFISIGVAMFSWNSNKAAHAAPTSPLGFMLLFASLFMDGVTGPLQERLVARHKPSTHQLMFWQNISSVAWLLIGLLVTGEGVRALAFVLRHPHVMVDIMQFSLVSAVGQNFIFYTVRNFNALLVTTITTTRKMFTVLLSIFIFNHPMEPRKWLGLVLVFAAISWEAAAKQRAKRLKAEKQPQEKAFKKDQ
ncbi:Solute carrier family 35 member B1 [Gracilariopsis chorda]|uniref:Solute carrier family 35 member B1 n=1 Tax=Gracilariopsis chorda TaxID=448386 RepID=A0A2V3IYF3_9FLOR|nr:Solute carrier family 35 member B1 [Gracilariopsis chorda]|eukprot:PXF47093.1 Solute carrier family 35 member B1 [Gracilariopsis chorda]